MRLPTSFRPPQHYKPTIKEAFKDLPPSSITLLSTLLSLNPSYRGTATSALQSQFFTTNPLACELSGLPVIQKPEDEAAKSNTRKKRKKPKKQAATQQASEGSKKQTGFQAKDDLDPSPKELEKISEEESTTNSQDTATTISIFSQEAGGNSTSSSTSSSMKPVREEEQQQQQQQQPPTMNNLAGRIHPSFSPVGLPQLQDRSALRTEAHPSASKNIQNNFTLLQPSVSSDILHHRHGGSGGHSAAADGLGMQHYRRSTLDFSALDPDKISKLFGLDDDR